MFSISSQTDGQKLGIIVLMVLLLFLAFWLAPWATFWAIGVLFNYHIPLNWLTWFAYWVLYSFTFFKPVRTSS